MLEHVTVYWQFWSSMVKYTVTVKVTAVMVHWWPTGTIEREKETADYLELAFDREVYAMEDCSLPA